MTRETQRLYAHPNMLTQVDYIVEKKKRYRKISKCEPHENHVPTPR